MPGGPRQASVLPGDYTSPEKLLNNIAQQTDRTKEREKSTAPFLCSGTAAKIGIGPTSPQRYIRGNTLIPYAISEEDKLEP